MARGNRFQGKNRLLRRLVAIPRAQRAALLASLDRSAEELTAAQRALVPVDKGDLRSTIRKELSASGLGIAVTAGGERTTKPVRKGASVSYDYALAQEFGTQDAVANPFFYPPYRLLRKRIANRAKRAARKAARTARGQ